MKIMVVSPHPDDETLGAGGTLLKMKKQGHALCWLNVTDMTVEDGWDEEVIAHRQAQIKAIRSFFGFDTFYNLSFPPTRLSDTAQGELIDAIRDILKREEPEWLIIPGRYDAHSDHHAVYDACMACAKSFRAPYIKRITTMEIPSETEQGYQLESFRPNLFIDITDEMEKKLEAMKLYDTEMGEFPFPRSIEFVESVARVRGSGMYCYAEAFCIVKQIE